MSLGQFATAVAASPRWVQNAFHVLGLERVYDEERAKILGLARQLHVALRIPLGEAYPLAREALGAWPETTVWRRQDEAGMVTLEVNLERYLSSYAVRLALARNWYAERKRGRPPKRRKRGIAGAREYGIDISLLEESLKLTPAQRLRRNEEALEFLRALRVAEP